MIIAASPEMGVDLMSEVSELPFSRVRLVGEGHAAVCQLRYAGNGKSPSCGA